MIKKFLCKIGFHTWQWKLSEVGRIELDGPIPKCAKCKHCGKSYE